MPARAAASLVAALGVLLGASLGSGAPRRAAPGVVAAAASSAAPPVPACVHVSKQAVYSGAGYDHVVSIDNGCDRVAACVVTTNVNPDPIDARVEAHQRADVVTYRGSPASEFSANVRCRLE